MEIEYILKFNDIYQFCFGGIFLGIILYFSIFLIQSLFDVFKKCVDYKEI